VSVVFVDAGRGLCAVHVVFSVSPVVVAVAVAVAVVAVAVAVAVAVDSIPTDTCG
jgi:hypothetical protein